MKPIKIGVLTIAVFILSGSLSYAQLYGLGNDGPSGLSTLYRINEETGLAIPIGNTGFERCGGMDFNPFGGGVYALCSRADGSNIGVLVLINLKSGAGEEVGPTGISDRIGDISFRNSDGVLFAEDVSNNPQHTLYTIDIQTGQATLVGDTGLAFTGGNGMTFNNAGTLLLQSTEFGSTPLLYAMDQTTGQAVIIRDVIFPPPLTEQDRFKAMKTDPETGAILGVYTDDDETITHLATLDAATGIVTQIGPTEPTLDAIAFLPQTTIPTLSEYGMIATAIVLLIGALAFLKRRQAKANV